MFIMKSATIKKEQSDTLWHLIEAKYHLYLPPILDLNFHILAIERTHGPVRQHYEKKPSHTVRVFMENYPFCFKKLMS